jgi:two-component system, NarL family, sensor histidine kinase UhpB
MNVPQPSHFFWPDRFENPVRGGRSLALRVSRWLWYDRSIRWQLLAAFVLISLVAGIAAFGIMLYNAQRATEVEITAAMELAEHLVRGPIDQLAQETAGASPIERLPLQTIETLPLRIRNLRHVRIEVLDAKGQQTSLSAARAEPRHDQKQLAAPAWFSALFQHDKRGREIPVTFGGRHVGSVLIVGQSSDEVAEVWQDLSEIALVAAIASFSALALLYLALGRILHPLRNLSQGLRQLEQGDFRYRLRPPLVRELADIAHSFNALAGALDVEKSDNARLNRRLITVQDDERRQIAMELHDEFGPCLFGLKANVASLGKTAKQLPEDVAAAIRERITTLLEIVDRIQMTNRRLLQKILPMAIGHAPIADVIANLVADFERHDSDHAIRLFTRRVAITYGDCIDLTIYRCVQEGLTNAVRHANARSIEVTLEQRGNLALSLIIQDDGRGIDAEIQRGVGLTAMEERVRALGGSVELTNRARSGVSLRIHIPLQP